MCALNLSGHDVEIINTSFHLQLGQHLNVLDRLSIIHKFTAHVLSIRWMLFVKKKKKDNTVYAGEDSQTILYTKPTVLSKTVDV